MVKLSILERENNGIMFKTWIRVTLKHLKSHQQTVGRGQSFVELALTIPVLLLLVAGMVEVVFVFNDYLQLLDGARDGARYISDFNPYPSDTTSAIYDGDKNCTTTQNFFRTTACKAKSGIAPLTLKSPTASRVGSGGVCVNPSTQQDDIVVSVFGVLNQGGTVTVKRYDNNLIDTSSGSPIGKLVLDNASSTDGTDSGWSFSKDQNGSGGMCSKFTIGQVQALLLTTAPSTGMVLVEVFYRHYQILHLPVFSSVIPNPIGLYTYAFFPLVAAEPTATP